MQVISGSVGRNCTNAVHDVALIQAMLLKTKVLGKNTNYLSSYDGIFGDETVAAIELFQKDKNLIASAPPPATAVTAVTATKGAISPNDDTWKSLAAGLPVEFSNLHVLSGGKTVYKAASAEAYQNARVLAGGLIFAPAFKSKVLACIDQMYQAFSIAVSVCVDGDRRNFQTQYRLVTSGRGVTKAGPSESNHNFGMATDIGFSGLGWNNEMDQYARRLCL
jgi:hypothetical protein